MVALAPLPRCTIRGHVPGSWPPITCRRISSHRNQEERQSPRSHQRSRWQKAIFTACYTKNPQEASPSDLTPTLPAEAQLILVESYHQCLKSEMSSRPLSALGP